MLDFSRQYRQIRAEILTAIEQVCDSQQFILGEEVHQFEAAAASLCGVAHGIGCASGTDALWLALAAAKIGPGDAVLTTPFTFFSTVSSIVRAGAQPLLADIDPKTYNLDPAAVAATLENLPKHTQVRAGSFPSICTGNAPTGINSRNCSRNSICCSLKTQPRPSARNGTGIPPAASGTSLPSASIPQKT